MIGSYWAMSILFAGTVAVFYYLRYGYIDATQLYLPMKFRSEDPLAKANQLILNVRLFYCQHTIR